MPIPTLDGTEAVRLASTLIEITSSVTHGAETIDIFTDLAQRCVELLPVSAAGILLRDASGRLQVIGASNPSAHLLDLFQVQNDEGPCLECSQTGEPISDESLVRGQGSPNVLAKVVSPQPMRCRCVLETSLWER